MLNTRLKIILSFIFFNIYFIIFNFIFIEEQIQHYLILFSLSISILLYFFSDKLILKLHRAKKINKGKSLKLLQEMSKQTKIKQPKLYLIKTKTPTIFSTGRNKNNSSIGISKELFSILSDNELKAIFLHEIYHIRKGESFLQTLNIFITTTIFLTSGLFLITPILNFTNNFGKNPKTLFLSLFTILLFPILLFVKITSTKKREFNADRFVYLNQKTSLHLISALQKLEYYSNKSKFYLVENFFTSIYILNPSRNNYFDILLSTHPLTDNRIRNLYYLEN